MPSLRPDRRCEEIASRQHGVLSRAQALRAGLTSREVAGRSKCGLWVPVAPGVYRYRAVAASWESDLMAAVLWAGPTGLASHRSAGYLYGLEGLEEVPVEILARSGRCPAGMIVHRLGHGDDPRRRRLLEIRDDRDGRLESVLETRLFRLLKGAGLPLPVPQYEVVVSGRTIARLDFAYPGLRLGIETHGYRWHGGVERWRGDIRRENRLKSAGWFVLVFTWDDVVGEPSRVIEEIEGALLGRPAWAQGRHQPSA